MVVEWFIDLAEGKVESTKQEKKKDKKKKTAYDDKNPPLLLMKKKPGYITKMMNKGVKEAKREEKGLTNSENNRLTRADIQNAFQNMDNPEVANQQSAGKEEPKAEEEDVLRQKSPKKEAPKPKIQTKPTEEVQEDQADNKYKSVEKYLEYINKEVYKCLSELQIERMT